MDIRERNFNCFIEELSDEKTYVSYNPFELFIALTNVCNLNCPFCPFCGFCMKKVEKPVMLPLEIIESMEEYFQTAKVLIPSGRGEPFLYRHFDEFINICNKSNVLCKMQLTNNGTIIGRYNIKKLEDVNIIGISFDAADKKTFELLRFRSKFQKVIDNIKKVREILPNNVIMFNVVVNRLNIMQMAGIYKIARKLGVNYITYNGIYGNKEDKVISLLRLRESDKFLVDQQMTEILYLNKDNKLSVENVITFNGFDDNKTLDYEEIYEELSEMKGLKPYLDYDEINKVDMESRRVKTENKLSDFDYNKLKLPYCTSPWTVLDIQPNGDVYPCCASYGTIDSVNDKKFCDVWNGDNIVKLREAMFCYNMLPDICKECNSWMRYNYINEYIEKLKENKKWNGDFNLFVIPPNYNPPDGFIKEKLLMEKITMEKEKSPNNKAINASFEINSEDYWNKRFDTDWNEYSGSQQTEFFAKIACDMFPEWFTRDIKVKQYTLCDLGCALGNGVDFLSKYLNISASGMDFSEEGILKAKEMFPQYEFTREDITNLKSNKEYDIIFCSNVLEHFPNPWEIFKHFSKISKHYIVLLIPFREKLDIHEHVYNFDTNLIPLGIEKFQLIYVDTIDGKEIENTYYPDQQILLIYSKMEEDIRLASLKDVTKGISNVDIREVIRLSTQEIEDKETQYSSIIKELNREIEKLKINEINCQKQINEHIECEKQLRNQITDINIIQEQLENQIVNRDSIIQKALHQCINMTNSKLFKGVHFINRLKYQGMKGNKLERKNFRKWFYSHIHGGGDANKRYNPMYSIINILNSVDLDINMDASMSEDSSINKDNFKLTQNQLYYLNQNYIKYDVIILSVIDYDFRYQRPQHFATRFVENGHRVFYINANFHKGNSIQQVKDNLFVINISNDKTSAIYETDWSINMNQIKEQISNILYNYCIRDAITIVDYPNWVNVAKYLREYFGFKIVTDYMDDFTGFLNPAEDLVRKSCIRLLEISDMVIPSSQFLYDIAKKYNDQIGIVRNGTEFKHFNKAANKKTDNKSKVIGYYGAVSHWFDIEKVCYLAKNLPDCEIVIIGEVTAGDVQLRKYSNINLLGEIAYKDLPKHLSYFDVCLIPFDTSTDLIKATNPVKFYEYLSAGKKIVATDIPELEPYKNKYVYMTNDNEKFLYYIQLCLEGKDSLASFDECINFGQANDWQVRYKSFAQLCISNIPKVSIIVLTYNNLKLNKLCIDSILTKTAYPRYELIIVDNQSTDGTREYLAELDKMNYSNVKVILNNKNSGFAGGNNIGIKESDGEYLLTLNNDTLVTRGWLTSMTKHLENNSDLGMCGPVTNSIGNEAKIAVNYKDFSSLEQFAFYYTWKHMQVEYPNPKLLALFCTMIKREVIDKCGLLDERYKVGMFEDDDYAEAVRRGGYRLSIVEDAFIHHFDGATFKKLKDENYRNIFDENKKKYEKKWNTKWKMQKYREGVSWDTNSKIDILRKN